MSCAPPRRRRSACRPRRPMLPAGALCVRKSAFAGSCATPAGGVRAGRRGAPRLEMRASSMPSAKPAASERTPAPSSRIRHLAAAAATAALARR
eukprot:scaffold246615_cov27-Tisochrysis_lutea.AAC.1